MDSNLDTFMGDGTDDSPAEEVIQITMKGAECGQVVSGWAIFDPHMAYFRSYRDEWTRELGQIRLYGTRAMAELAAAQDAMEEEA
ncbi:MAG: hypothetical protein WD534_12705 [Phycisphaeraceae bacterium]